jgi:crossover junction endodeoxyribonuclease RuvC
VPDDVRILGIDPALAVTGYGVITFRNDAFRVVEFGEIRTSHKNDLAYRLHKIYSTIRGVVSGSGPHLAVLEEGFYAKNVKIALGLGQARGAAMVACAECGVEVRLYSAKEIKQSVVGSGSASKEQVSYMVKSFLGDLEGMESHDITDALGAAICAAFRIEGEQGNVRIR